MAPGYAVFQRRRRGQPYRRIAKVTEGAKRNHETYAAVLNDSSRAITRAQRVCMVSFIAAESIKTGTGWLKQRRFLSVQMIYARQPPNDLMDLVCRIPIPALSGAAGPDNTTRRANHGQRNGGSLIPPVDRLAEERAGKTFTGAHQP
jgi:hypothetical protein